MNHTPNWSHIFARKVVGVTDVPQGESRSDHSRQGDGSICGNTRFIRTTQPDGPIRPALPAVRKTSTRCQEDVYDSAMTCQT
ncbi:hypothetical protein FHR38_005727 [Micromonospora polyrhachis]|uniref:Uncharacterized protein n=1 Tax=Micromonospora polyrhachis TaxID=1282883 RepID=A0A7W7SW60_9ACTN|nr:hypothetical protein [Micromonospora polyrhachis]